jgi:hypothetical protein
LVSRKYFLPKKIPFGGDDEAFDGAIDVDVVVIGFNGGGNLYYSCYSWPR